ncbi:hypothetical protein CapIbe_021138 [Capra ibex]
MIRSLRKRSFLRNKKPIGVLAVSRTQNQGPGCCLSPAMGLCNKVWLPRAHREHTQLFTGKILESSVLYAHLILFLLTSSMLKRVPWRRVQQSCKASESLQAVCYLPECASCSVAHCQSPGV